MKIKKSDNGNVQFLNADDEVLKSFSPLCTVASSGGLGKFIRVEDQSSAGSLIEVAKVSALIKGGVETAFTGDSNDLMVELSDNFFFDSTQAVV